MFSGRMAVAVCLLESKWVPSSTLMAVGGRVELENWWIETGEQLEDSEWHFLISRDHDGHSKPQGWMDR
ncbi:hypothetical protein Pcinc_021467 [Petrolisthes cinctipes]|uniref:Uncharacterized protein n=1 Tax=Petrolisthes cinctipes TaxID=88211 RepID=A0AAE1FH39_PETCI|nr:hypothetical protein Pcinc_021467 [Petrolisthes cinctipes]